MRNFIALILALVTIHVSASIHADFSADKFSGCPPLLVNFLNTSQPTPTTWSWNFGNGNTSSLPNPSAVFNTPGVYNVKLIVTNGTQKDSIVKTVTVFRLPQVDFHAATTTFCQGDTVRLINDVIAGSAPIVDYAWGFGDGTASSVVSPYHIYNQPGTFNTTLVVQDGHGCTANASKNGYIQILASPQAEFTASPAVSCNASQSISFTNNSVGSGLTYLWTLDAGVTSSATIIARPRYSRLMQ